MVGILLAGAAAPSTWASPARAWDVADAKGVVEALIARLGHPQVRYEPAAERPGVDHPGRTATIVVDLPGGERMALGRVGEIHPSLLAAVCRPAPNEPCSWSWSWRAWPGWCPHSCGWATSSDCRHWSATSAS